MNIVIGLLIPFIGTSLGSLLVYFIKDDLNKSIENIIWGFASGVMVAASIWSLLIPAMEISMFASVIGFSLGILIFCLIDMFIKNDNNLMLAVTIHNIPEGMAVGISFASYLMGLSSLSTCLALSTGIGIQNFPEGSIVSLPLFRKGFSKNKAFIYGVISAVFELLGAIITLLFTSIVSIIFPYFLALAAGAMFYVVIHELIPESSNGNSNVIGFLFGFIIMLLLDVYLG